MKMFYLVVSTLCCQATAASQMFEKFFDYFFLNYRGRSLALCWIKIIVCMQGIFYHLIASASKGKPLYWEKTLNCVRINVCLYFLSTKSMWQLILRLNSVTLTPDHYKYINVLTFIQYSAAAKNRERWNSPLLSALKNRQLWQIIQQNLGACSFLRQNTDERDAFCANGNHIISPFPEAAAGSALSAPTPVALLASAKHQGEREERCLITTLSVHSRNAARHATHQ